MNQQQLSEFAAQGFNRVPLMRELIADLDTPLSVYLKMAYGPYSYLLESVQGGEKWGRYSIIGLPCRRRIEARGNTVLDIVGDKIVKRETVSDPLAFIDEIRKQFRVPDVPGMPRFTGGLVGYFGYDTVRYIEPKLAKCTKSDPIGVPDIVLLASDEVVVFDNLRGKIYIVVHVDPSDEDAVERGEQRLNELQARLSAPLSRDDFGRSTSKLRADDFKSEFGQEAFEQSVNKIKSYITAGDVMQVVISQRLQAPFDGQPLDLYRALRTTNPSPYMYYFDLGDFHIVGSSPEILVRTEGDEITVRPIAGTRPRGKTDSEDKALEKELLADPKEIAEHLMLIDLGRNDAGRVAQIGSVRVTDKMVVERYSHVMHIVSNVVGKLDKRFDVMDVLRATFPAGTVSGAPKVRAMEIIDELEPSKRGVYSGAVGYIGWNGNMDTAIAIRTAVIKNQTLYVQAGAGVVYDSVPLNEWVETINKGKAVTRAAELAAKGLDAQHA